MSKGNFQSKKIFKLIKLANHNKLFIPLLAPTFLKRFNFCLILYTCTSGEWKKQNKMKNRFQQQNRCKVLQRCYKGSQEIKKIIEILVNTKQPVLPTKINCFFRFKLDVKRRKTYRNSLHKCAWISKMNTQNESYAIECKSRSKLNHFFHSWTFYRIFKHRILKMSTFKLRIFSWRTWQGRFEYKFMTQNLTWMSKYIFSLFLA